MESRYYMVHLFKIVCSGWLLSISIAEGFDIVHWKFINLIKLQFQTLFNTGRYQIYHNIIADIANNYAHQELKYLQ